MINKKISVVCPCYNEQDNIINMYNQLTAVLNRITSDYEIIFTDNRSTDNSEQIFRKLSQKDKRVSVILFSRNFGTSDVGYTAGTAYATGQAVVWIDGDIQDPPEMIAEFVKKWQEGYDVVYGIRKKREGSPLRVFAYKMFYRLFKAFSYLDMPLDAGDFCLMDRKVVDAFNAMPERDRFVRGLRCWAGFKQTGIEYLRRQRMAGKRSTNLSMYIRITKRAIFSFSYLPLEAVSYLAFVVVALALIGLIIYFVLYIITPDVPRGVQTIITLVLFLGGIQLLSLSIIGEYLGRIFEETKRRPKYIIREILNNHRQDDFSKIGKD